MSATSSWLEISAAALRHNFRTLQALDGGVMLAPVVKANAYGHGMVGCAEVLVEAGARWLVVNELASAARLQHLDATIYVVGPTFPDQSAAIKALGCHVVVSSRAQIDALAAAPGSGEVPVHVKIETGTNRQGLVPTEAARLVGHIRATAGVRLAGLTTHLADVEDETEHTFARVQIQRFLDGIQGLTAPGVLRHCAASAAHLLLPEARLDLVRPGIATYGLWPSAETQIAASIVHGDRLELRPAMTWKTRIAQVRDADRGDYVGYGRTLRLARPARIAVLPVGYYDGYDRRFSGRGVVLVHGKRAPIAGRICMNMCMIDVSQIPAARAGDEVVLLSPALPADELADLIGTINYELTTRIHERLPRRMV